MKKFPYKFRFDISDTRTLTHSLIHSRTKTIITHEMYDAFILSQKQLFGFKSTRFDFSVVVVVRLLVFFFF